MNLARKFFEEVCRKRRHVVVIGDAMTDVWIHGQTSRCQEGCLKFMEVSCLSTPGGAANARRSLSNWNVHAQLFGHADNVRPIKYRFMGADGRVVFRYDDETMLNRGEDYEWIRSYALGAVERCDAVLLSDYDKGFLTKEFVQEVSRICCKRNIPCVADCKRPPEFYGGCTLKYNREYEATHKFGNIASRGAVITFSFDGPLVYDQSGVRVVGDELPAVTCVNHVGAGDCFAAHLTLALSCEFSLKDAAAIAHSAGRVYVQHPHNRPPHPNEVIADVESSRINVTASGSGDDPEPV